MPFHEIRVRETHIDALEADAQSLVMWSAAVARLARAPPDAGVKYRKNTHDRRPAKTDILDAAIAQFPHLVKKVDGIARLANQTYKYRLAQLYVDRYGSILVAYPKIPGCRHPTYSVPEPTGEIDSRPIGRISSREQRRTTYARRGLTL